MMALQPASSELIPAVSTSFSRREMFAEHFHLQIIRKFFIGQSLTALALFCCSRNKNAGLWFPVFLAPYRLTLLVVTGAVCRYQA
jgi:hypothetical protein